MARYFLVLSIALFTISFFALPVLAADPIILGNPLEADTLVEFIDIIINIIFTLSLWIMPLLIVLAGILFVTAVGNPSQIQKAQNLLLWTIIGFVVILSAKGVITLFKTAFPFRS